MIRAIQEDIIVQRVEDTKKAKRKVLVVGQDDTYIGKVICVGPKVEGMTAGEHVMIRSDYGYEFIYQDQKYIRVSPSSILIIVETPDV